MTTPLFDARIKYLDAAITELNAVVNLIDNPNPEMHDVLVARGIETGNIAQLAFEAYRQVAAKELPQNPALADLVTKSNEN